MNSFPTRSLSGLLILGGLFLGAPEPDARAGVGFACPSVAISPYGAGCAVQFDVPVLKVGLEPSQCLLTLQLSGFPGCCNTYLANRIFIFGAQPTSIPVPPLFAGCTLLASPDLIFVLPGSFGNELSVYLPAVLDVTIFAQGVNDYFTTIGLNHDYNWSNGVKIDIS